MTDIVGQQNRIPSETLSKQDDVQAWVIPSMDKNGRVILTGQKELQARKQQASQEVVEDYKPHAKPKPLTAEQLKEISDQAHKDGFEEGYREGLNKGMAEGHTQGLKQGEEKAYKDHAEKLTNEQSRLKSIADALMDPLEEQDNHIENMILDLSIKLAEHLMQTQIEQDPRVLYRMVERVVNELPMGSKNITVHVNEKDRVLIESCSDMAKAKWSLDIDNTLASGGCRVSSEDSLIDFDLAQRMQAYLARCGQDTPVEEGPFDGVADYREAAILDSSNQNTSVQDTSESHRSDVAESAQEDFAGPTLDGGSTSDDITGSVVESRKTSTDAEEGLINGGKAEQDKNPSASPSDTVDQSENVDESEDDV